MTEETTTPTALEVTSDVEIDQSDYHAFKQSTQLQSVEYLSLSAERIVAGNGSSVQFRISPQFHVADDRVVLRYDAGVDISDNETGEILGAIKASLALNLVYDGSAPSDAVITHFGQTEGLELAVPYIREIAQNLSSRLGFPTLTLPLISIPRGETISGI